MTDAGNTDRAELAGLAAGLAAELQRREFFGLRRTLAHPAAPAPGAESNPRRPAGQPAPARTAAPAPARAPAAAQAQAPAPAAKPAAEPAPAPRPAAEFSPTAQAAAAAGSLDALAATVAECRACGLCETRNRTVFADGGAHARVMFVGEAPGAEEDRTGVPFVGKAGQLLGDIITKGMGLAREDVYIANVLKCRPPGNRDPQPREKELCTPYLERQIELVDPEVLIPLGRHASNHLLGTDSAMGALRGRVHESRGRKVVPTFHPAYLLRSPAMKKPTWEDIQLAMAELGMRPPGR